MQELPLIIDFRSGLNPETEAYSRSNSPFLSDLDGLRVAPSGLESTIIPTDPFNGQVVDDYPFPNLGKGDYISYLFFRSRVESVDSSWNRTPLTLTATNGSDVTITEGGRWDFVDLKEAFYASNGEVVIFKTGLDNLFDLTTRYWIEKSFKVNAITEHMGRVVVGGPTTEAWSNDILDLFNSMLSCINDAIYPDTDDVRSNWVIWSSVGGGDFPLWLFYPQEYPIEYRPNTETLQDRIAAGDFGWAPMPYDGAVLGLKSLGKNLISYGEGGIAVLQPVVGGGDIAPTFGINKLSSVGIYSRGSYSGSSSVHYFLDPNGDLWRLTGSLELNRLGYQDYFKSWIDNEDEVSLYFDEIEQELYLTNGEESFLYSNSGLSSINGVYTWVTTHRSKVYGSSVENSSKYKSLCSSKFDGFKREVKTITAIHLDVETDGLVEVSVKYKYNLKDNWNQTSWHRLNNEGNTALRIAGSEFQFCIRVSNESYFRLGRATLKVQYADKRFSRGPSQGTNIARDVS
jgi:hypothetical protein